MKTNIIAIFDSHEILTKDTSCFDFVKLLITEVKTVFVSEDNNNKMESDLLQVLGIKGNIQIQYGYSIQAYLEKINKENQWVIVLTDRVINNSKDNCIVLPYKFWKQLSDFRGISFTEHAKKKILYNELSSHYMEAIANNTKLEVEFLKNIFSKENVHNVIDCCCGVGRHDYLLGRDGYKVIGIDISEAQIQTAKKIHANKNVKYVVGDIREFSLKNKSNDAAICMWTTYNYLSQDEDLRKFFNNVAEHIHVGGLLVLDSKNIPILDSVRMYIRNRKKDRLDMELLVFKRVIDNIQNSQYFYFINENGSKKILLDEEFVRFYYLDELLDIASEKYELINVYGDFLGNEYDVNRSERMISVWRRKEEK